MRHSARTRKLIATYQEVRGLRRMNQVLDVVRSRVGGCYLTDQQIADLVGVSSRQVRNVLRRLVAGGILRREVRHFNFAGKVRCTRRLWEPDAVPEGKVRREGDAGPRS